MVQDSEELSDSEIDQIAEAALERLGETESEVETNRDEQWYLGKYASKFIERVTEGAARGRATAIQDDLRRVGERFFERNAIYKTNVQQAGRVAIPEAEMDTLGLEGGETVQVILFPIGENDDD